MTKLLHNCKICDLYSDILVHGVCAGCIEQMIRQQRGQLDTIRDALAPYLSNPTGDVVQDLRNVLTAMVSYKTLYNDALDALEEVLRYWEKETNSARKGIRTLHILPLGKEITPEDTLYHKARALLAARRKERADGEA